MNELAESFLRQENSDLPGYSPNTRDIERLARKLEIRFNEEVERNPELTFETFKGETLGLGEFLKNTEVTGAHDVYKTGKKPGLDFYDRLDTRSRRWTK